MLCNVAFKLPTFAIIVTLNLHRNYLPMPVRKTMHMFSHPTYPMKRAIENMVICDSIQNVILNCTN